MAEDLLSDYLQQTRGSEQKRAGDELLAKYGLDQDGQPLPEGAAPAPAPATSKQERQLTQQERVARIPKAKPGEEPGFFKDVVGGSAAELVKAPVAGVVGGATEMLRAADELQQSVTGLIGVDAGQPLKSAADFVERF